MVRWFNLWEKMIKEYLYLGFGLEIVGAFILVIVNTSKMWHGRYENIPFWKKRYWWMGWRPIFKIHPPSEKPKWKIKFNHKVVRYGRIPPKHRLNWFAFLLFLIGIVLQILSMN